MQEEGSRTQRWERRERDRVSKVFLAVLLALLATTLLAKPGVASVPPPPEPLAIPQITSCSFAPDPRSNVSVPCVDDFSQHGYLNVSIRFTVNVSDADGDNLTVTFYFDTSPDFVNGSFVANTTGSPFLDVPVVSPGPGTNATAEVNWTYDRPSSNDYIPGVAWYYWVFIEVNDTSGADPDLPSCAPASGTPYGNCFFQVYVNRNTPARLDNLSSLYDVPQAITFPDETIPLVFINVTVFDDDDDAVTVTWDWGDGSRDVYRTGPALNGVPLNATHRYPGSAFPLNESNRAWEFSLRIWADDGIPGHNASSLTSAVNFQIGIDFRPNRPAIVSPDALVHWKVNETIPMSGFTTDPEGDPITLYYWDFNDRVDSNGDGNPYTDRDAIGNVTSHAYTVPGDYNVTLWATDGENKVFCFDANCSGYQDHWTNFSVQLHIRYNEAPLAILESLGDGNVNLPMSLHASTLDLDADPLNVTWDFGDGKGAYNLTAGDRKVSTPAELFQQHVYATPGNFTVTVSVQDGWDTTVRNVTVFVQSQNLPPGILPTRLFHAGNESLGGSDFKFNESVYIRINVTDPENDPLDLEVDWGDGNVTRLNLTGTNVVLNTTAFQADCEPLPTGQNGTSCVLRHAYLSYGAFPIRITLTDHQLYVTRTRNETTGNYSYVILTHTVRLTVTIDVPAPPIRKDLGPWDWWDYSTLALIVGIPGVLIGRDVWRNFRERREE